MSPLPSPTPLRRALLRVVFSPAALLCGFVVLVIITCPGARGSDAIQQMIVNGGLTTSVPTPERAISPTARLEQRATPFASPRSRTPAERGASTAAVSTSASNAGQPPRTVVPLVSADLPGAPSRTSASIVPMTGPPVGIRPRMPAGVR